MSERYSRLFTLPENLYAVGSPVVIAAGTLLKDNQTGKIVAQLKLKNISNKPITAVKVEFYLFDTAGNIIEESVVHDYLDLDASRDSEFAQKSPVPIPNGKARSYKASVIEVVFVDRSVWNADGGDWESLKAPSFLMFEDYELRKQYEIKFGKNSVYNPHKEKDLWYCTCGALNHEGEKCHICHNSLLALQALDLSELAEERDARLEAEAKQAAEDKAAKLAKVRKIKKLAAIIIPSVAIIIAVAILISGLIKKNTAYDDAVLLMTSGKYDAAVVAFQELGNFKDSPEKILETKYNKATALLNKKQYEESVKVFASLGDYADSIEQMETIQNTLAEIKEAELAAKYNNAIKLLKDEKDEEAYILFEELGNYKDSQEYIADFHEMRVRSVNKPDKKAASTIYYYYNDAGQIESTYYDLSDVEYTTLNRYDANGNIVEVSYEYLSGDYNRGDISSYQYYYDENNRLVEEKEILLGGHITRTFYQWYNESGELLSEDVTKRMDDMEYATCYIKTIDDAGNTIKSRKDRINTKGDFIAEEYYEYTYVYDTNGKILQYTYYHYDPNSFYRHYNKTYKYEYQNGQLVKDAYYRYTYYPNGEVKTRDSGSGILTHYLGMVYTPDA